jgi:dihydrofolate synthase/folylpolyglutamate synthase
VETSSTYQKTLDYLYSFVDYSLTRVSRWSADKFDLRRMDDLLEQLGRPERNYASIHIAGTKGKGSVSAFCASALRAAGYRTGLYTSPHLHDYTERIRVNGKPIPKEELVALVNELKPVIESIKELTTFEITTALAFLFFSRLKVEAAVIEVGLGGRLDATNVILPVVSVITSLSYDHTFILGNSLEEIASEKAGIIKHGVPVVLAPQVEVARQVIQTVSVERSAPLIQVGTDVKFAVQSHSLQGIDLKIWGNSIYSAEATGTQPYLSVEPVSLHIPLLGDHQVENAAVAYTALEILNQYGLPLPVQKIQQGFSQTQWPGRFEVLSTQPAVVLDCAHNRDSAMRLRLALEAYFPHRPIHLIYGASEDKDIEGMFAELMDPVEKVILTRSFHPRAAELDQLLSVAARYGKPVCVVPDIADALDEALREMDDEHVLLITGSIFIVAGAREAWMARCGVALEWS